MSRPMTAEEVHDVQVFRWTCEAGCPPKEDRTRSTYSDAKDRAKRHCERTGHTVHVVNEHRHVMEIREIPT
jgi:hypothetical protein